MSILVDDSNKTACRAAEARLQQKNCAALVRPAGTGKGCIVWELLDAHPEMRVLWVVSCAARLELRRALTKRLGRTLGGRVRLMSCEQLAVQNALGWVALAEFRPGLLVLDGWREMSAKNWTDCVQPLFRLCPGAKLLALGEPDAPGDSCRAAEEMLADAIVEPLALGGAMAEGLLPMPASYTALLWPLEDAMARLRAEVKNLHLPGCPDFMLNLLYEIMAALRFRREREAGEHRPSCAQKGSRTQATMQHLQESARGWHRTECSCGCGAVRSERPAGFQPPRWPLQRESRTDFQNIPA